MAYPSADSAATTMIDDARTFYEHGWLLGMSGNLSMRLEEDAFLITASECDKGRLTPEDFVVRSVSGETLERAHPEQRASTDTPIHEVIYRCVPQAGAVYHVHEPYAAFCSERDSYIGATIMAGADMIKALGIDHKDPRVRIPIFENHFDPAHLGADLEEHLGDANKRQVPGINVRSHGIYAWGETPVEAKRHVETFAYLFRYSWELGNGA
jgi:methylthioribulose-1-phosphate dehydratase